VALCQARISTKPLWGFSSSNPYHSQSRAEQQGNFSFIKDESFTFSMRRNFDKTGQSVPFCDIKQYLFVLISISSSFFINKKVRKFNRW
jgi:hypothetical protein